MRLSACTARTFETDPVGIRWNAKKRVVVRFLAGGFRLLPIATVSTWYVPRPRFCRRGVRWRTSASGLDLATCWFANVAASAMLRRGSGMLGGCLINRPSAPRGPNNPLGSTRAALNVCSAAWTCAGKSLRSRVLPSVSQIHSLRQAVSELDEALDYIRGMNPDDALDP